jgi:hypothetical protein
MSFTTDGQNLLLNWGFTTGTANRPTAWAVGLHTADPTETGAVSEVLVGTDSAYTRKNITYATSTVGQCLSTLAVTHTPSVAAGTYIVTHVSFWATAPGVVALMYGALLVPRTISNASPLSLSIGDLIAALD